MLTVLNRAQAKFATQNPENYNVLGELPEMLQFLSMYVFGLLKSPLLSPVTQVAPNSNYLDEVAELKFLVNSMSPEEVLPLFQAQIYNVNNPQLSDEEWPEVSKSFHVFSFEF